MDQKRAKILKAHLEDVLLQIDQMSYCAAGLVVSFVATLILLMGILPLSGFALLGSWVSVIIVTVCSISLARSVHWNWKYKAESVFDRSLLGEDRYPKIRQAVVGVSLFLMISLMGIWQLLKLANELRMLLGIPFGVASIWLTPKIGRFASLLFCEKIHSSKEQQ
jgi:hypothetical protein